MNRTQALKEICSQYPYQRSALKLNEAEFDRIVDFIDENDSLGHLEFEYKVNRMFLFDKDRPKHWTIIQDILTAANSRVHVKRKEA